MSTMTQTSTGDVWTYTYDFRNRMTGAVEKTSGGTVLAQATYTYDALDNRIGTDENGTQTWTLYDGSTPVMDFSGAGSLAMRYLNGPTGDIVDTVLARESSGGTIAWYLPDRLGTIRDLLNNSGSIIDHVDYSAFGTVLDESSPTSGDRLMGFAGLERDSVTGLNLAVHRVENPGTGRWGSEDPVGFRAGDADLYRIVRNDPANLIDPAGLSDDGPPAFVPSLPIQNPIVGQTYDLGNGIVFYVTVGPDGTVQYHYDKPGAGTTVSGPIPGGGGKCYIETTFEGGGTNITLPNGVPGYPNEGINLNLPPGAPDGGHYRITITRTSDGRVPNPPTIIWYHPVDPNSGKKDYYVVCPSGGGNKVVPGSPYPKFRLS
jgi:RHS repeat-associated protein